METGVEVVCLFLFIVPGIVHIGAIKYILKEEEDHKSIAKEELITLRTGPSVMFIDFFYNSVVILNATSFKIYSTQKQLPQVNMRLKKACSPMASNSLLIAAQRMDELSMELSHTKYYTASGIQQAYPKYI